jgi:hypothetical protein
MLSPYDCYEFKCPECHGCYFGARTGTGTFSCHGGPDRGPCGWVGKKNECFVPIQSLSTESTVDAMVFNASKIVISTQDATLEVLDIRGCRNDDAILINARKVTL